MQTRRVLLDHLKAKYSALDLAQLESLTSENLISDHQITLPTQVLKQAQDFVKICANLRYEASYKKKYSDELAALKLSDPGNDAISTSFDFHLNEKNELKLIEINTNAAFLVLAEELYAAKKLNSPCSGFKIEHLKKCVLNELTAINKSTTNPSVAIVDEDPGSQRLFIEFLVYEQLFKSFGWNTQILDSASDLSKFDFIYNRDTDFYLQSERLQNLKSLYTNKNVALSPHPYQYFMLADKQRMIDWRSANFFDNHLISEDEKQVLFRHLPFVESLTSDTAESIWSQRKSLFLKPKRSFGAKQSYRGGSISRKLFEELISKDLLAQEFIPAPETLVETPTGEQKFKYDLRFYTYRDQVQSVVARIYQGQVTNLKTPFGGFTPVMFADSHASA